MKTDLHLTAREVTQQLISPLSEATRQLFAEISLQEYDYLEIKLAEGGKLDFQVRPFGRHKKVTTQTSFGLGEKQQVLTSAEGEEGQLTFLTEEKTYDWEECNCSWPARTWPRRVPEVKEDYIRGTWWMAGTDFNVLLINSLWPSDRIIFDEDAKTLYFYLLTRFLHQAKRSVIKSRYYLQQQSPEDADTFIDSQSNPLLPYQRAALSTCINQEASALFMEQGTGKTPVVIARICNEAVEADHMYRALIVCPKNVRANWLSEFQKFATVPGKMAAMRGPKFDRIKILVEAMKKEDDRQWTAVVCSYDIVERTWDAMKMIKWDLVVLDESHYIKSGATARWKQMAILRELADSRMCLTGTPICNSLMDIRTQLEFLGEGLSGFKSPVKFRQYYGRWEKRGQLQALVGYNHVPLIQERLARLSFQITKKDALPDLPDKVYDVVEVSMTKEQRRYYIELRDRLVLEIEAELAASDNKVVTARNALVKLLRLAQITSGFITYDKVDPENEKEERQIDRIDPNPKIEALVELLKDKDPNDKTIIWACWVQDIKTIAARLREEGHDCVTFYGATSDEDREAAVERFNKDQRCKIFIGNPSAGGVGLNLLGYDYDKKEANDHCNVTQAIYYSQNWSPQTRSQSEDRCHRKGTRTNVRYTDLCVPGTIDEEIRCRVLQKRQSAAEIQDVKSILQRILDITPEVNGD